MISLVGLHLLEITIKCYFCILLHGNSRTETDQTIKNEKIKWIYGKL